MHACHAIVIYLMIVGHIKTLSLHDGVLIMSRQFKKIQPRGLVSVYF